MGAVALLIVIVYGVIAGFLSRTLSDRLNKPDKWFAHPFSIFWFLMLIPFTDVILGYLFFFGYCVRDSGIEVYQRTALSPAYFMKPGEKQSDDVFGPRSPWKVAQGGELNLGLLIDTYDVSLSNRKPHVFPGVIRRRDRVVQNHEGQLLGRKRTYVYHGGVLHQLVGGFANLGECPTADKTGFEFYNAIFYRE